MFMKFFVLQLCFVTVCSAVDFSALSPKELAETTMEQFQNLDDAQYDYEMALKDKNSIERLDAADRLVAAQANLQAIWRAISAEPEADWTRKSTFLTGAGGLLFLSSLGGLYQGFSNAVFGVAGGDLQALGGMSGVFLGGALVGTQAVKAYRNHMRWRGFCEEYFDHLVKMGDVTLARISDFHFRLFYLRDRMVPKLALGCAAVVKS